MDRLVVEGTIVQLDGQFYGQVHIDKKTGLIEYVGPLSATPDLVVGQSLIFPGFSDVHVHAREDASGKQSYKEDFLSMSEAAIHGGVVQVVEMPNNPVAPVTDKLYREKKALTATSLIDVVLYGGIGPHTRPLRLSVPYKVFMGPSVGDLFFTSKSQLEEVIQHYKGECVSFHCEDPELLEENKGKETHELQRPRTAEIQAVDFALKLIKKYDLQGKVCHCTTKEAVEKIAQAKTQGLSVTCEVTPHNLYFDESMLTKENRPWLQVNPPLRTREDRVQLLEALRHGTIDFLATDHAPHTREEKLEGVSGFPHLDTYGAFTTWLMKEHNFTPQDIARVCSLNPGRFVNPFLPKDYKKGFGRIEEGYIASLSIINPDNPFVVSQEELKTKCAWSPFEGIEFPGRVQYTIVKGKIYEQ